MSGSWNFDNTYTSLPDKLYAKLNPVPVKAPQMVYFNDALAEDLGLPDIINDQKALSEFLSGNAIPQGAEPLAQAYAGHQFGHFNMLGDGRAVLLGEHVAPSGDRLDIQLKGSGQTPYSRRGDGRATLSSMLREYLISEAMYHLGIPSTRSLAVVETGEEVYREYVHQGAILTRIASSHIRVGTFEFVRRFATKEDLKAFNEYVIKRHYPELMDADNPALELVKSVMDRQIDLIVEWMRVGFIHGVMNTDNMSISGETIDYGPCAFMNAYHPRTVFSSIDTQGRYAFANQPAIAHWNLAILAGALLPLIDDDHEKAVKKAQAALDTFPDTFRSRHYQMMYKKLGIIKTDPNDHALVDKWLDLMEKHRADYTNSFLGLTNDHFAQSPLFGDSDFEVWKSKWQEATGRHKNTLDGLMLMGRANPMVIPRNHQVESVLEKAVEGEMAPFDELLDILSHPYKSAPLDETYQMAPAGFDMHYQTFCGT
ncbi:MAG: YdiU family protein [Bacteroidota bacterium]